MKIQKLITKWIKDYSQNNNLNVFVVVLKDLVLIMT